MNDLDTLAPQIAEERDQQRRVQEFLSDPNIPDDAKRAVAEQYQREWQTRYTQAGGGAQSGSGWGRVAAGAVPGAIAGIGTTALAGPQVGIPAGFTAYGLGTTAYDLATGQIDPLRAATQAGTDIAASALPGPIGQVMRSPTARGIAANAIGAGISGAAYDAAMSFYETARALGRRDKLGARRVMIGGDPLRDIAQQGITTAGDVAGGAIGKWMSDTAALARPSGRGQRIRSAAAQAREEYGAQGIQPPAASVLRSPAMARIEEAVGGIPIGGGAIREAQERRLSQIERGAVRALGIESDLTPTETGQIARTGLQEGMAEVEAIGARFADLNERIGDPPVVPTAPLMAAIRREQEAGRYSPAGPRHGVNRMANMPTEPMVVVTGETRRAGRRPAADTGPQPATPMDVPEIEGGPEPPQLETRAVGFPRRSLGPYTGEDVRGDLVFDPVDEIILEAVQYDAIPWRMARLIQQELGQRIRTQQPIRDMSQRRAALLYRGISEGIDQYLQSPEGQQFGPEFNQLREQFREVAHRWQTPVLTQLLADANGDSVALLQQIFSVGGLEKARRFRDSVPPDYWRTVVQGWMHGKLEDAINKETGQFDYNRFLREMTPYQRGRHFDEWLDPGTAEAFDRFTAVLRDMNRMRGIAGRSSGTAERAATMGQIGAAGGAVGLAATGNVPAAAVTLASVFAAPKIAAELLTSQRGLDLLIAMAAGPQPERARMVSGATSRFLSQEAVNELANDLRQQFAPLPAH